MDISPEEPIGPADAVFSTGSRELDAVLEALQAGDNVVYYTERLSQYLPFVKALIGHAARRPGSLVYVRSGGTLDEAMSGSGARVVDLAEFPADQDIIVALQERMASLGPRLSYVFEPFSTLLPWLGKSVSADRAFVSWCPLLSRLETVAYWNLNRGDLNSSAIAAIKDCTQIFISVDPLDGDLLLTPLKVWGRYSEAMFRPHRVAVTADGVRVQVAPADAAGRDALYGGAGRQES